MTLAKCVVLMANSAAAAFLASKITLLSEIESYLNNQMELPENKKMISKMSEWENELFKAQGKIVDWESIVSNFLGDIDGLNLVVSDLEALFTKIDDFYTLTRKLSCNLYETEITPLVVLRGVYISSTEIVKYFDSLTLESVVRRSQYHTLPSEISNYVKIGEQLTDLPEMLAIRNALASLILNDDTSSIYAAIVGPSYMGKTQSAFTLAHAMNVFYVNLMLVRGSEDVQHVYMPFRTISKIFSNCLLNDMPLILKDDENTSLKSSVICTSFIPLQTLGLLYTLLRIKYQLPRDFSVEDWFLFFINLKNIIIPKMTVSQFITKIEDLNIDLRDSVVFIDELVSEPASIGITIKLLRNICRAVHLPVILSGTNSKVQNLVGTSDIAYSRVGPPSPWVKVAMQLPRTHLNAFSHMVKFKHWDTEAEQSLSQFINSSDQIDTDALISQLIDARSSASTVYSALKSLVVFTLEQSKSSLPGLARLTIEALLDAVVELRDNSHSVHFVSDVWKRMLDIVVKNVVERKRNLIKDEGRFISAHLLTFPSDLKTEHEMHRLAASKVEQHLFYFGDGSSNELVVTLTAGSFDGTIIFQKNDQDWIDRCFLPVLSQEFFVYLVAWNSWWFKTMRSEEYSLAALYESYLDDPRLPVSTKDSIPDFFALELLAHWAICYASHYNSQGETDGLDLLREFIKNLQKIPGSTKISYANFDYPSDLAAFLRKVRVPYLVSDNIMDDALKQSPHFQKDLEPFMKIGKSWRPESKVGWDVLFDAFVNEQPNTCYIECKLWQATKVGLDLVHKYYERAYEKGSKVNFLIVQGLSRTLKCRFEEVSENDVVMDSVEDSPQQEISDATKANLQAALEATIKNFANTHIGAKIEYSPETISKVANILSESTAAPTSSVASTSHPKKARRNTKRDFEELWDKDEERNLNLYSVTSSIGNGRVKFEFHVLKEFPNAAGIFIVIQSNFIPRLRSSTST